MSGGASSSAAAAPPAGPQWGLSCLGVSPAYRALRELDVAQRVAADSGGGAGAGAGSAAAAVTAAKAKARDAGVPVGVPLTRTVLRTFTITQPAVPAGTPQAEVDNLRKRMDKFVNDGVRQVAFARHGMIAAGAGVALVLHVQLAGRVDDAYVDRLRAAVAGAPPGALVVLWRCQPGGGLMDAPGLTLVTLRDLPGAVPPPEVADDWRWPASDASPLRLYVVSPVDADFCVKASESVVGMGGMVAHVVGKCPGLFAAAGVAALVADARGSGGDGGSPPVFMPFVKQFLRALVICIRGWPHNLLLQCTVMGYSRHLCGRLRGPLAHGLVNARPYLNTPAVLWTFLTHAVGPPCTLAVDAASRLPPPAGVAQPQAPAAAAGGPAGGAGAGGMGDFEEEEDDDDDAAAAAVAQADSEAAELFGAAEAGAGAGAGSAAATPAASATTAPPPASVPRCPMGHSSRCPHCYGILFHYAARRPNVSVTRHRAVFPAPLTGRCGGAYGLDELFYSTVARNDMLISGAVVRVERWNRWTVEINADGELLPLEGEYSRPPPAFPRPPVSTPALAVEAGVALTYREARGL
jgi:hypothetical protein